MNSSADVNQRIARISAHINPHPNLQVYLLLFLQFDNLFMCSLTFLQLRLIIEKLEM